MKDKTVLITGATSGIGKAVALDIARRGAKIIMVGRDRDTAEVSRYDIIHFSDNNDVHLFFADLSLVKDVKNFALSVSNVFEKIDVLINCAGTLGFAEPTSTDEGIEHTLAINFLAPSVLSLELINLLQKSESPQIINMSSRLHKYVKIDWADLQSAQKHFPIKTYARSMLLNTAFTLQLSEKCNGKVRVNCVDPGVVYSNIARNYPNWFKRLYSISEPFMRTTEKGAESIIKLIAEPGKMNYNKAVVKDCRPIKPSSLCRDEKFCEQVWKTVFILSGINDPFL